MRGFLSTKFLKSTIGCFYKTIILILIIFSCSAGEAGKQRNFTLWGKYESNDCCGISYDSDDDPHCQSDVYCSHSEDKCLNCFLEYLEKNPEKTIQESLYFLLPAIPGSVCEFCLHSKGGKTPTIYRGYLEFLFFNERPFLKRQLSLAEKYPNKQLYWVETSQEAALINDFACNLFEKLFDQTVLKYVGQRQEFLEYFPFSCSYAEDMKSDWRELLPLAIPGSCFHFSDYYYATQMVRRYAKATFYEQYSKEISEGLDEILDKLAPLFLKMYRDGLKSERIPEFEEECTFLEMVMGLPRGFSQTSTEDFFPRSQWSTKEKFPYWAMIMSISLPRGNQDNIPKWQLPEIFYQNGLTFNDHMLHQEAINSLSQAIALDPKRREFYIERATAYFETDQIELAIKDYESAKQVSQLTKKNYQPPLLGLSKNVASLPLAEASLEFASGLLRGVFQGGQHSTVEFIPSILTSCRGLLFGLWPLVFCLFSERGR